MLQAMREEQLQTLNRIADGVQQVKISPPPPYPPSLPYALFPYITAYITPNESSVGSAGHVCRHVHPCFEVLLFYRKNLIFST